MSKAANAVEMDMDFVFMVTSRTRPLLQPIEQILAILFALGNHFAGHFLFKIIMGAA
jgi:hypothetical protein